MTPSGIELETCRFVAKCLNHYTTARPLIQRVPGLFAGGKGAGAWHWSRTPSSAEVKETVELYLSSGSGMWGHGLDRAGSG